MRVKVDISEAAVYTHSRFFTFRGDTVQKSIFSHIWMNYLIEDPLLFLGILSSHLTLILKTNITQHMTDASWRVAESTQTVQVLQHQTGEGPLSANKEVEIRSLKSEIDILKKQIAGQNLFLFIVSEALWYSVQKSNLFKQASNQRGWLFTDCSATLKLYD